MAPLSDLDLESARLQRFPAVYFTFQLGVRYMGPEDEIRTKQEIKEYRKTGDVGAARALIQHAKARRENWSTGGRRFISKT